MLPTGLCGGDVEHSVTESTHTLSKMHVCLTTFIFKKCAWRLDFALENKIVEREDCAISKIVCFFMRSRITLYFEHFGQSAVQSF